MQEQKHKYHFDHDRRYSVITLVMFFFTFSIIGWIWEVLLFIVQEGQFINRGVLHGPWLPIYGTGGVLMLLFLRKFFDKPVLVFLLIMLLCSVLEYFTGWFLEYTQGVRWWDYSGYFMNLNGRICLEGAIFFGLGGCAIIYFIAPFLGEKYEKLSSLLRVGICVLLVTLFVTDGMYSRSHPNEGKGITDYKEAKTKRGFL